MRPSLTVLIAIGFAAGGCASARNDPSAADAEVRAATQQWIVAFNTCQQPRDVASLYDRDALFWGTVSRSLITSTEAVSQYFEPVCASAPRAKVELGPYEMRRHGDSATSAGHYTFTFFRGGQALTVPARFSFAYRRDGDRWLIVGHHSSSAPAAPQAPQPRQ